MNPLHRLRRDRRRATTGPSQSLAATAETSPADAPEAAGLLGPPLPAVYVAVPPDDLDGLRIDVALDVAAFYNTLREGQIGEEHALVLTQTFFPRGRWG